MKYEVITAYSIYGLVERVNVWIEKGWEPLGGVHHNGNEYFQAMIKK